VLLGIGLHLCAAQLPAGVQLQTMFASSGKPGLGQIGDGVLLAISGGIGDWRCYGGAQIRKSTNGGVSWGGNICAIPADWSPKAGWCTPPHPTPNVSMYGIGNTHGGPVLVGHAATRSATMLFDCIPNAAHPEEFKDAPPAGGRTWAVRSTDEGETWGEPWDLTGSIQVAPGNGKNGMAIVSLAIGGGIEVVAGPHRGRLVAQAYGVKCFGGDPALAAAGQCNRTALARHFPAGDPYGESPAGWAEINYALLSDDAGLSWYASAAFGVYGAEGEVAELFDPPGRLMWNYRVDAGTVPRCPGGASVCNSSAHGVAIACTTAANPLTNPASCGVVPHHCRATMVSDDGLRWTNAAGDSVLFGDGVADLPDVGQKGGFCRGPARARAAEGAAAGWMVMANAQDNRDPGDDQQPRANLTVSLSSDGGKTWPHSKIVWPARLGGAGYSSAKFSHGLIAVHFTAILYPACAQALAARNCTRDRAAASPDACIACAMVHQGDAAVQKGCCIDCNLGRPTPGWTPQPSVFANVVSSACSAWSWPGAVRSEQASVLAVVDPNEGHHRQLPHGRAARLRGDHTCWLHGCRGTRLVPDGTHPETEPR
jgi:hypothetical protein